MYNEHTNEELTVLYHKVAQELSFFNSAEQEVWKNESFARNACQKIYLEICSEFKFRNLPLPKGNYLI